ncbi:MAG: hypothetical protein JWM59_3971 [Verrucomicrobiales bacterium]|nr:hypothetical protein [Verrucomicrobiales bacterium]
MLVLPCAEWKICPSLIRESHLVEGKHTTENPEEAPNFNSIKETFLIIKPPSFRMDADTDKIAHSRTDRLR